MNNTLRNGFRVIEYLSSSGAMHSVKDVGEVLGIPSSHACRLLKTLVGTGYVEQDCRRGGYRVPLKVLGLSNVCLSKNVVRMKGRPFLSRLADRLDANSYLSVPVEGMPMIVDVVFRDSAHARDPGLDIGSFNPIHCSASGKVCAAFHPADMLDVLLARCSFEKFSPRTIISREDFLGQLPAIRRDKSATSVGEKGDGVSAVASPIFGSDGELAGVVGVVLPRRLADSEEHIAGFAGAARETAEAVSFALGFAGYDNI